ncbi:unnamed protein product [Brassica oleracea]
MVLDQTKSNSFQVNEEMIETLSELMIQVQEQEMSETQRAEMQWSPIMLTYGFPLAIIGMALKYAELKPVPCLSYADAVKLRESSATPILTQVLCTSDKGRGVFLVCLLAFDMDIDRPMKLNLPGSSC